MNLVFDEIPIEAITPLHEPRQENLLEELIESMEESGWKGRPLLVIEREDDYLAWTGSHRLAAAVEAGFSSIPCYVLQESVLKPMVSMPNGDMSKITNGCRYCEKLETKKAIQLMYLEGRPI